MRNWKLLFLIVVIIPALFFTACSDNGEEPPIDLTTEIVAKWKWQNQELNGMPNDYKEKIEELLNRYSPFTKDVNVQFKEDKILALTGGVADQQGTYEIKNNTTVVTNLENIYGLSVEYTAKIRGNNLTLTLNNNSLKDVITDYLTEKGFADAAIKALLAVFKYSVVFEKVQ